MRVIITTHLLKNGGKMKLRNKKTGEIVDYNPTLERWNGPSKEIKHYVSLAELNAEWCDAEDDDES